MSLDQLSTDLADVYRAFIADTARLRYGPADLGHDGRCDSDSNCCRTASFALISASHAACGCAAGCDIRPASLAFLCFEHVHTEPVADWDAAQFAAEGIEGTEARLIWRVLMDVYPAPIRLPEVEPAADTEQRRDALAQATAEHIATHLIDHVIGGMVDRIQVDGKPMPTTVPEIKATLLAGEMWLSWMSDSTVAAMRALHGEFDSATAVVDGERAWRR